MLWLGLLLFALVPLCEVAGTRSPEHDIEVYFVVDQVAQQKYKNEFGMSQNDLRVEIDYMITEIDKFYRQMGIGITIYKRKLEFLTHDFTSSYIDHTVSEDFKKWLKSSGKHAALSYDMAILLTGHDLHALDATGTERNYVAGLSTRGGVCDAHGTGISELDGSFTGVVAVAHEIGHLLGARHDPKNSLYIMAPSIRPNSNFMFSPYTASQITAHLSQKSCQGRRSVLSTVPNQSLPPRLNTPDKLCKRLFGASGHICGITKVNAGGDAVCQKMECSNDAMTQCRGGVTAYNGMICGKQKVCKQRSCVTDTGNPKRCKDAWRVNLRVSYGTKMYTGGCNIITPETSSPFCSTGQIKAKCCASCAKLASKRDIEEPMETVHVSSIRLLDEEQTPKMVAQKNPKVVAQEVEEVVVPPVVE